MKQARKPRKSLRSILMLWFLLFSVAPLAFITGYSLVKYEQAIDQEMSKRLRGNSREISVILNDFEQGLVNESEHHANDKSLIYYLSKNSIGRARSLIRNWMKSRFAHRIWLYNQDGRLEVALYRDENGDVASKKNLEGGDVYLSEQFLSATEDRSFRTIVDVKEASGDQDSMVDLVVFHKVKTSSGRTVGYLEEVINMDQSFMDNLKKRFNLELFFYQPNKNQIVATHKDLKEYSANFFNEKRKDESTDFFELVVREDPYRFTLESLKWGDTELILGLGASKSAAKSVLKNVNNAFFVVVGTIILLLVILSVITSKILLKPLYEVLDGIQNADFEKGPTSIPVSNETELGLLAESFNDMSGRVYEAQEDLRGKIKELEDANIQIRETQAKLVHTAKMASLGQLVAGVAHELNNPIGFIYSNMSHLRDYSQKLIDIVNVAERSPEWVPAKKKEADFDFILEDMPKLIKSCEDGAKRTRDIVLGLRSFSRLEEAQLKEIDIHESIENTLRLLTGEVKNRITVTKDFSDLPKISCYPSQLNQVFMNILSNAAQAIEGEGEIRIRTEKTEDDKVSIAIKDTGKGMSQSTAEKIFDPFFTTKTLGQGTGLGLSISYGIVQQHGGDIRVESEVGKGTEFTITLPIQSS